MTTKSHKAGSEHHMPANSLFKLFEGNKTIWGTHRSAAKALLETQDKASAHISRYRKMMDEMRDIVRREQDFALETSRKACEDFAEKGWLAVYDMSAMSAMMERVLSGSRALGEAWMKAQKESHGATHAHDGFQSSAKKWSDIMMAAGPVNDGGSKRRPDSHRNEARVSQH